MEPAVELGIQRCEPGRLATVRIDAHQARIEGGKHDVSVRPPRCAAPDGRNIADDNWSSARDRDALQLSASEEGEPLSVGREERVTRAVGVFDRFRVELGEAAQIETGSSGARADVREPAAIWRHGDRPSGCPRVEYDVGRQRNAGPNRRRDRRDAARQHPCRRCGDGRDADRRGSRDFPARSARAARRILGRA